MPSQSGPAFNGSNPALRGQSANPRTGRPDTGGEQLDVLQTGHHQHRANQAAHSPAAQRRVHDIADAPGRGASIVPMTPRPPGPSSQAGRGL